MRRAERTARVTALFGRLQCEAALDILELTELAWHDVYGQVTPPGDVVDDILVCSRGQLGELARSARLAVEDWRDLRLRADSIREHGLG